jgi:hypothetical protein
MSTSSQGRSRSSSSAFQTHMCSVFAQPACRPVATADRRPALTVSRAHVYNYPDRTLTEVQRLAHFTFHDSIIFSQAGAQAFRGDSVCCWPYLWLIALSSGGHPVACQKLPR